MSIADRAIAASHRPIVQDVPRDPSDRDRLREEWRLAADLLVDLEDRYQRLRDGKSIFFDELVEALLEQSTPDKKITQDAAKRTANTSQAHKDYLRRMHDARLAAARQRIETDDRDRRYWQNVSREATERRERAMSR